MRRLILGTAGHIDHGKTALVKALTGVDTDRLKEEQERGITIDLGFAEYQPRDDVLFGVVDVPGHEGFIRNMLAGATGMDLVLLVVAADEGVMPQTREHLAIVRLLGVPRLAVAITKADLVEADWLELVQEEARELLEDTPYAKGPILPVSSLTGTGLSELGFALADLGMEAEEKGSDDAVRLPIDRVFTIKGAGTVVTGTLWTGSLCEGAKVRVMPGEREGRVRSLQVHGQSVPEASAGARVAVGLSGSEMGHHDLFRGQTVVEGAGWSASWMLTVKVTLLSDSGWNLEQGQRVRVHLGTAEILGRVAIFDGDLMLGGAEGWVQLRLEEPILARVGDHFVLRSYSPVTTLGGGRVAEVLPRKRRKMGRGEDALLRSRLETDTSLGLVALLEMAEWLGVAKETLPHRTGFSPHQLEDTIHHLLLREEIVQVDDRLFPARIWAEAVRRILLATQDFHEKNPLKSGIPLEVLRQTLPGEQGPKLAEVAVQHLAAVGDLLLKKGTAAHTGFRPTLSKAQESLRTQLRALFDQAGTAPPSLKELGETMGPSQEIESVLRLMEDEGEVLNLDRDYFFTRDSVTVAGEAVVEKLGGAQELGPAEFKEVLLVSRRHLLPLLRHFDLVGVTTRIGDTRGVATEVPKGWGTLGGSRK